MPFPSRAPQGRTGLLTAGKRLLSPATRAPGMGKTAAVASGGLLCGMLLLTVRVGAQLPPGANDAELVARAEKAIAAAQGTPGQEAANFLVNDWPREALQVLRGHKAVSEAEQRAARGAVMSLTKNAEAGPTWPLPALIHLPRARHAPVIDGDLGDPAWKDAASWDGLYAFNAKQNVAPPGPGPATRWKAAWDEKYLYFAFDCEDKDVQSPPMARDDKVYAHDCVEMFLLPEFRHGLYWELVIGPSGTVYDGLNAKKWDGWGPMARTGENIAGLKVGTHISGTEGNATDVDQGYRVEVAVPFAALPGYTRGNAPHRGDRLHFMLVRLDRNGQTLQPYSFLPLLSWGHNLWNHAPVELSS